MQKLRKRFGQHFLIDKDTIENIVLAINPLSEQNLCEIGPGNGAITFPIIKKVKNIQAIEIDRNLASELIKKIKNIDQLKLHQTDVLKFDFNQIGNKQNKIRLFGNLPYNISTPLLFHIMQYSDIILDMHFMLQKEVVDRITAKPSTSEYSRLSISVQSFYTVQRLFDIPPEMFTPAPKVMSSFMRLIPNNELQSKITNRNIFNTVIEKAFQHRRKTIKNNLSSILSEGQLLMAEINPSVRPQDISLQQYIMLSNLLSR